MREAELALKSVKKNRAEAEKVLKYMKAYQLFAKYYERKVASATAAMIYAHSHKAQDKAEAERLADESLQCHLEAAGYAHEHLDPIMQEMHGMAIAELITGKTLPETMEAEKEERQKLARIFDWPEAKKPRASK